MLRHISPGHESPSHGPNVGFNVVGEYEGNNVPVGVTVGTWVVEFSVASAVGSIVSTRL